MLCKGEAVGVKSRSHKDAPVKTAGGYYCMYGMAHSKRRSSREMLVAL